MNLLNQGLDDFGGAQETMEVLQYKQRRCLRIGQAVQGTDHGERILARCGRFRAVNSQARVDVSGGVTPVLGLT